MTPPAPKSVSVPTPPTSLKESPLPPKPAPAPLEKKEVHTPSPKEEVSSPVSEASAPSPMSERVPIKDIPEGGDMDSHTDDARWSNNSLPVNSAVKTVSSLADTLTKKETPNKVDVTLDGKPAPPDPLYSPEIDEGLNQLLSEWSLFKKSGLFGTGPKGREHPLFKKVAGLQIPLLLAGRFEGATQEIKQSITDYMNGWRYEQGIMYTQGETFERYLRRVISHILDLQKKKTPA